MIGRLFAFVVFAVLQTTPILAENVLLTRGDNQYGQGWLFLDRDGVCRIATPKHVIEGADGSLVTPDVLDSFGRVFPTSLPVAAATEDLDLAFLVASRALAEFGCSNTRISAAPVQAVIDRMVTGQIAIATPFDRQTFTVEPRAITRDTAGGAIVAFAPAESSVALQKGMSGGVVTVSGRPIAMLTDVDPEFGIGIGMRFDVIAREIELLPLPAPSTETDPMAISQLVVRTGRLSGQDSGIGQFLRSETALQLQPQNGRVVLVARLDQVQRLTGIQIGLADTDKPSRLIVETGSQGSYSVTQYCTVASSVRCSFTPRLVDAVRLTVVAPDDTTLRIEHLSIE